MSTPLPKPLRPDLQPGGVVQLRSGGIAMTIESLEGEIAHCVWSDKAGRIQRDQFPTKLLKRSTLGSDGIILMAGLNTSQQEIDDAVWGSTND